MLRSLTTRQLVFDVVFSTACVVLRLGPFGVTAFAEFAFVVLMGGALALRRLAPGIALGVAWLGAVVQMLGGMPPDLSNLAILAVLYATAAYGTNRVKWLGLVSAGVGAGVAALYLVVFPVVATSFSPAAVPVGELPFTMLVLTATGGGLLTLLGLSWTLGLLARTRAAARTSRLAQAVAEEEERQARRLAIVEQERNRIARDMHDVVAHSLAVVIAQADGARYAIAADPAAASDALSTISTTAREALGDVRLLLGQLRHNQGEGPQPSLDDLERLLDQMRSAGLTIDTTTTGEQAAIGTAQQLAVYRIVQEALTNVLRHGDVEQPVRLAIEWQGGQLSMTIDSAVRQAPETDARTMGHGLAGMRERAVLVGGWLTAEPRHDRFLVEAGIPTPTEGAPVG